MQCKSSRALSICHFCRAKKGKGCWHGYRVENATSCSAIGCKRKASKKHGIKLYRFLTDAERRHLWTWVLKRESWEPNKYSGICGAHFISGKYSVFVRSHKAAYRVEQVLTEVTFINITRKLVKLKNDPDYVPSVFVHFTGKTKASSAGKVSRKRLMKRCEHQYAAKQQQRCSTQQKQRQLIKIQKYLRLNTNSSKFWARRRDC